MRVGVGVGVGVVFTLGLLASITWQTAPIYSESAAQDKADSFPTDCTTYFWHEVTQDPCDAMATDEVRSTAYALHPPPTDTPGPCGYYPDEHRTPGVPDTPPTWEAFNRCLDAQPYPNTWVTPVGGPFAPINPCAWAASQSGDPNADADQAPVPGGPSCVINPSTPGPNPGTGTT